MDSFDTEARYDKLTVNGRMYSGAAGPSGVVATGVIEWFSDFSVTKAGWRICGAGEAPVTTTTQAPVSGGSWQLASGSCVQTGNCISSPGYPGNYGNNEVCRISIEGAVSLNVDAFSTEVGYDKLVVNGQTFQGTAGPQGVIASGEISWTSDRSVTSSGWKICIPAAGLESGAE